MTAERPNTSDDQHDLDVLIGRIIDGEAQGGDLDAFADRAAGSTESWRSLAEQQNERSLLVRSVASEFAAADQVSLPSSATHAEVDAEKVPVVLTTGMTRFVQPVLAYTGWAAALTLVFIVAFAQPASSPIRVISREAIQDHIQDDVEVRKLDPIVTMTNHRPDGMWDVLVIERSEHHYVLDRLDPNMIRTEGAEDEDGAASSDL